MKKYARDKCSRGEYLFISVSVVGTVMYNVMLCLINGIANNLTSYAGARTRRATTGHFLPTVNLVCRCASRRKCLGQNLHNGVGVQ